ncbi:NAD(P)H-dependent oxidoreductase [Chitinophaga agrisoli]|uniref:NAD(P)H-dependent oxidoreductase n=1 Tax=Chitinophaga agrisoli TaxID=2607653 RepID=A0A5B2W015_9BACT|nr:NAD(P)H-dependent oxidoreductase [Chitinophaga agrisoli]KAA2243649.1 NAD(P)H-dependent oxidoreductase [Chitinophaga agrisoli]
MKTKSLKKVLAISGSTRKNSTNLQLVKAFAAMADGHLEVEIFNELDTLPHFNPDLDDKPPAIIKSFRKKVQQADGVLICSPEYVFSLPGSLKNALEWMVSTTFFSGKPVALITAAARGLKAHESLQLIMKTIEASFTDDTVLLIQGIQGKITPDGEFKDAKAQQQLEKLTTAFTALVQEEK